MTTIAVVGAGFSGVMTAVHLLSGSDDVRVVLIERRERFARGAAYDTDDATHRLNVRAEGMSAFPDQPDHLLQWLEARGLDRGDGFVGRGQYGRYLEDVLAQAETRYGARLRRRRGSVVGAGRSPAGFTLTLDDGEPAAADAVILAIGNLEPGAVPGFAPEALASPAYVQNPWDRAVRAPETATDVLLVGSGLTMVDVAISLDRQGRRITALSRNGRLPLPHLEKAVPPVAPPSAGPPLSMFREIRRSSADGEWRGVLNGLRTKAAGFWRNWTPGERRGFVRHLRALWDVHRHRLAPAIWARIESMMDHGRLSVVGGRIVSARTADCGLEVEWRPRGMDEVVRRRFDLVVNCTGPLAQVERSADPLIRGLLDQGLAVAEPLGLGFAVEPDGRLLDRSGRPQDDLVAVGPLARGPFWEMTAVPDLRLQAQEAARALLRRRVSAGSRMETGAETV
ncbi:FAD/NAD(P)-binding protein [Brevundimonas sp. PAMC22021]|uniref:FAD/NAD(P)-binding protein n=1 Tax=Brevundimonas sp. PAMC22021 TaxID=2861285 RepID=UPI001C634DE7|nr:FAD/NAD(P)-binding protein [Brevundimonas sp. PAMC22021]QYF85791.1 FAD/NAD(P)-binding protein [Brevundimonas sp. PAMC22021]